MSAYVIKKIVRPSRSICMRQERSVTIYEKNTVIVGISLMAFELSCCM